MILGHLTCEWIISLYEDKLPHVQPLCGDLTGFHFALHGSLVSCSGRRLSFDCYCISFGEFLYFCIFFSYGERRLTIEGAVDVGLIWVYGGFFVGDGVTIRNVLSDGCAGNMDGFSGRYRYEGIEGVRIVSAAVYILYMVVSGVSVYLERSRCDQTRQSSFQDRALDYVMAYAKQAPATSNEIVGRELKFSSRYCCFLNQLCWYSLTSSVWCKLR